MLNLFNSFRVPGVEYVEIFHDDTDDSLYYMLPELPTVVHNEDGEPAFHLIAFARDFTLLADSASELPAGELEGGLLSLTTELRVSEEDQATIRAYIQGGGQDEVPLYRPMMERAMFRISRVVSTAAPVRLAYPTFIDGSVSFGLFPGDDPFFITGSAGTGKPSLAGTNIANYAAMLGQMGVRMIRRGAEQGYVAGSVNYQLRFVARIPSVSIHIYGDCSDIYNEIKEHTQVTETYTSDHSYSVYTYPQVSSLQEIRNMVTTLHIDIDTGDFNAAGTDPAAAESVTKQIETMALGIIQNQVMPKFFSSGLTPGLKAEKLGTNPFANKPGATGPPAPNNQMYLKNFTQEMTGSIDVTFTARTNILVNRNPNTGLLAILTPEQLKHAITEADLSTPYFTLLDVPVRVTANFDKDPIAAIKVFLEYDEKDDKTGQVKTKTDEFVFDSEDKVFHFRTIMARDSEGRPKDTYKYRSQIVYKATAKTVDTPEITTDERSLIIGYDKLDCVQVEVVLGAIPTGLVERVQVHFKYPGANTPTAESDVILTDAGPIGSWFTYTGGSPSREYDYTTTFFMADGQQISLPLQHSVAERLVINAPFNDRLMVTFVAQGVFPPIGNIIVSTRYSDPATEYDVNDVHTLNTAGETWKWEVNLRDKNKRDFQYKVDVNYADGSTASTDWAPGSEGTVNVGVVTRALLQVEVVPTLIDFTKWKLVLVRLKYTDATNHLDLSHDIQLTPAGLPDDQLKWEVPVKDPAQKSFSYSIQAFGVDGSKTEIPETSTVDPLVLVQV